MVALLGTSLVSCTKKQSDGKASSDAKKIKIGVSIWSSTDTLGSQCKRIIDEAAKALDVQVMYVDQGHISENVYGVCPESTAGGFPQQRRHTAGYVRRLPRRRDRPR